MDLDTRQKRASALGLALAALVILPAPDATIDQADQQQVSFSYSGILAEELNIVEATSDYVVVVPSNDVVITVPADSSTVVAP